jgi:hypothetical protein
MLFKYRALKIFDERIFISNTVGIILHEQIIKKNHHHKGTLCNGDLIFLSIVLPIPVPNTFSLIKQPIDTITEAEVQ